jgi:hypothetical protein
MFPATGSTKIAARPSPNSATVDATASTSLYLQTIVSFRRGRRHAGACGEAKRCDTGTGAREEGVDVTVVATGELEDAVSRREGAGEPNCAHRRLRPGGDEPDLLDGRHRVHDLGGELDLGLGRSAEARAELRGSADRFDRLAVGVSEDEGAPGHDPVEVAACLRLDVRAGAAAHE